MPADPVARLFADLGVQLISDGGFTGAALTIGVGSGCGRILWSSDATVRSISESQFGLGEGPSVSAAATFRPVLIPHANAPHHMDRWPMFWSQVKHLPLAALGAFPLQIAATVLGTCDVYRSTPGLPTYSQLAAALRTVDRLSVAMLVEVQGGSDSGWPLFDGLPSARAVVHQATGMIAVELKVPVPEAFARLRGHAFATEQLLETVAADVVARRLSVLSDLLD